MVRYLGGVSAFPDYNWDSCVYGSSTPGVSGRDHGHGPPLALGWVWLSFTSHKGDGTSEPIISSRIGSDGRIATLVS